MAFIVIEGPNGAGKSTLAAAITDRLKSTGLPVLTTQEPTKTPFGLVVRSSESYLSGRSLALAVAADRCAHVESMILPALDRGESVVCDRYVGSSLALQALDGMTLDEIYLINGGLPAPDVTYYLDVPSTELEFRLKQRDRQSRFEATKSRDSERQAFKNAYEYLNKQGWKQFWVNVGDDDAKLLALRCLDLINIA